MGEHIVAGVAAQPAADTGQNGEGALAIDLGLEHLDEAMRPPGHVS